MDEQRFVLTDNIWARLESHLPGKKSDSSATARKLRLSLSTIIDSDAEPTGNLTPICGARNDPLLAGVGRN